MNFRSVMLMLMLMLSLALPAGAVAAGADLTTCARCHGHEGLAVKPEDTTACQRCHDAAPLQNAHAGTPPQAASPHDLDKLDPMGMRYPIYNKESRLGPEPNEMILIPAGAFIMGTDKRLPDEGPQHTVSLPAYYIDKYEVTNLQYKKFIDATDRKSPRHFKNRTFPEGKADHPVTFVTWFDADAYCRWAGKRLPTDQEWEKAARGTDGRMFPWGETLDLSKANTPMRWAKLGAFGDTTPVGAFAGGVSPYGLYDMSGNVWEWTASWYQPYPGNKTPSESYGERYKVLKGGSWWDCSFYQCGISAPVFNRSFFARKTANDTFGFRCARDAAAVKGK